MSEATGKPAIDTDDMVAVHRVFRSAFGDAPRHIAGAATDPARVQMVTDFYANVFAFLHAHHEGEDSALIPLLLDRSSEKDLVSRVAAQHQDILAPLADCEQALQAWHDSPDERTAAALDSSIAAMDAVLTSHLDDEESKVLPECAAHITAPEWGAMPGHTLGAFKGDKIWLILGLIREQMTEEQKANMLANMPPPAVEMWTTKGNAAFDEFVGTLRRAA